MYIQPQTSPSIPLAYCGSIFFCLNLYEIVHVKVICTRKKMLGREKKRKQVSNSEHIFFNTHRDFYFFSLNSLRCYYFKFRKENRCQYVISLKITSPLCMAISLFYSPHSSHFSLVDRYYSLFPFLPRLHVLIHLLSILCRCLNFFLNTVCLLGFSQTAISDSLCMVYS